MKTDVLDRIDPLPAAPKRDIEGNLVSRARDHGPVRTSIEIVLGSYLALAAVMIGLGLLVTHFVVGGVIGRWDDSTVRWLVDHRSTGWNHLASNLSRLADTVTVLAVALIVAIVLAVRRHWKEMLLLGIALPLELAVFLTANAVVDRPRPDVARLGSLPSTSSFPSGHIAAAIVLYGGIMVLVTRSGRGNARRPAIIMGWIFVGVLAAAVGMARLYEGMHHPTDVMAGAIYGSCCLAIGALVLAICSNSHRATEASR